MRVQFFLDGPFDPVNTLSVTYLDENNEMVGITVKGGEFPQYQLWAWIAELAARDLDEAGFQLTFPTD